MSEKEILNYDLLILGGGPAGLSAGIYGARGNVSTAIVDISMFGGQPSLYLEVENYPGFKLVGGFDLMNEFEEHADQFAINKYPNEEIISVDLKENDNTVETSKKIFKAKTLIIAVGAQAKKLGIPGEKEFAGRGVSYCAICDGSFFRDKVVTVVGGGNAAVEEAIYLTKFASKVNLMHRRDSLRADKIVQERAFKNPKINFIWNAVPVEIKGENTVSELIIKNTKTDEVSSLKTDGVFPYIGFAPNSQLFASQLDMDSAGFIVTDEYMQTSVPGVYAAGDIRTTPLRQIITAAADGAVAATSAIKYLEKLHEEVVV